MGRRERALLLLSAALSACSPSPPSSVTTDSGLDASEDAPFSPDPCKATWAAGLTATLMIGEGQLEYRDIPEDTELTWEKGPQGGHHVWIALRQRGMHLRGTLTTIDLEDVENPGAPVLINHSKLVFDYTREEGGFCTLSGMRMQLDNAGGVLLSSLEAHHVRVTVTLKDSDGHIVTASKRIIVRGLLD